MNTKTAEETEQVAELKHRIKYLEQQLETSYSTIKAYGKVIDGDTEVINNLTEKLEESNQFLDEAIDDIENFREEVAKKNKRLAAFNGLMNIGI